jgi:hypothetical protein
MANRTGKGVFKKGDKRINRAGRPKDFTGLRKLAQLIANEKVSSKDGTLVMSRIELIMRDWASSKDAKLNKSFVEFAYGKVPDNVDVTSGGQPITLVEVVKPE